MKIRPPNGWKMTRLRDVCKIVSGSTPSTENPNYWNGDIFWATPKDLGTLETIEISDTERRITKDGLESCSARLLPKGTVLLTTRAPIGHVAIAGVDIATNQGFKNLVCSGEIYNKFLYFLLKFFVSDLQTLGRGATFTEISKKKVEEFEVPLPPLPEQKRIVAKLEELFENLDRAKKLREEAIADTENIIPSSLSEIFRRAKKEGWKERRIEEICEINPSKTEIRNLSDNLDVSFVPMSAVDEKSGTITNLGVRKLKEVRKGYTYFKEGDVLFAKITPCMENGKAAIARNLENGIGFGSTEFHILRPFDKILSELVHFFIRQKTFREEAERYFTGTAGQQRVPEEFIRNATFFIPPLSTQHRIVEYLDSLQFHVERLKQLQSETQKELDNLKKSILHKAFKGKL